MTRVRLLDPLDLRDVGPSLLAELRPLTVPGRRFEQLLRDRPEDVLVVVALDETGAIGWSTAQPDGVIGAFVHPKRRGRGLGRQLVEAVSASAAKRWPNAEWQALTKPGSPERRFFEHVWRSPEQGHRKAVR